MGGTKVSVVSAGPGDTVGVGPLRWSLRLLGLAAVLGALVALCVPLTLGAVDRAGNPIGCGSGFTPSAITAQRVDTLNRQQHTLAGPAFVTSDYVGDCASLIGGRRWVSATVAAVGVVIVIGTIIDPVAATVRSRRERGQPAWVSPDAAFR